VLKVDADEAETSRMPLCSYTNAGARCLFYARLCQLNSKSFIMTNEELITVARTHTVDMTKLSGEPWANQETLNKVTLLDTVIVSFESDDRPKKIMVLLEPESGHCIANWLFPREPK